jgi:uncharacterized protein DUF4340
MERYRTTLILGGILIVLAAVAIFLSNNKAVAPGTATPTPVPYVWQDPDPVNAIDIVSGTNKTSLKKNPSAGTWALTQPVSKPADLFTVSGEADKLQNLQSQFSVTDTTDLAQFGLGPGAMAVTLTFSNTQGSQRSFTVGKTILDGSGYYIKPSDANSVFVVANTTIEPLRSWLTSPPIETPSPTPLAVTIVPQTPTPTVTDTPAPGTPAAPGTTATATASTATATSPPAVGPPGPTAGTSPTP